MDQSDKLTFREKDLEMWFASPVTRCLLELLKEHKEASEFAIVQGFLNVKTKDIDMYSVAELKGQAQALEKVLETTEFLEERLEKRTVTNEEDDTVR